MRYSGGVAQSVRAPNSNCKVASSILNLAQTRSVRKTFNANILTIGDAAQWIRAQVTNHKATAILSTFDSVHELSNVSVSLNKNYLTWVKWKCTIETYYRHTLKTIFGKLFSFENNEYIGLLFSLFRKCAHKKGKRILEKRSQLSVK